MTEIKNIYGADINVLCKKLVKDKTRTLTKKEAETQEIKNMLTQGYISKTRTQ